MSFHDLLVSRRAVEGGVVATLTLHRPQRRNALSPRLVNELLQGIEDALGDPEVRVIVLEGGGATFCAGADLGGGGDGGQELAKGDFADLLAAMVRSTKPIVAKVRGYAVGGGVGLAAASHFAVAADDATFSTPEVLRGLWPMMIMAVLARTVRRRDLLEMMLLGQKFGAAKAAEVGVINRCVPEAELDAAVDALTAELATRSPTAMARGLAAWAKMGDLTLDAALPVLRDELYALFATDDAREGMTAFMEKRAPRWTGR
ncbi:MAG: enoyl-CoA hydratase-related protein [Polyangiales bacterium]